jgi:hypothetical protein
VGDGVTSLKEPRPNVLSEFTYRNGDAEGSVGWFRRCVRRPLYIFADQPF